MPLKRYREKRSADRTPEPFGKARVRIKPRSGGMFVVQKHAARRLHYDFRLEMEGVLRSWAVPKGPSLNPKEKRLAVMVEDHPLEYGDFEGAIPPGQYGAGSVIVWDRGQYEVIDPPGGDAAQAVRAGKLDIEMHGYKLRGAYTLVRMRGAPRGGASGEKEQWLLIKKRDSYSSEEDVTSRHPRSVLSGLTVEEIGKDASGLESEMVAELRKLGAPALRGPLTPRAFPLSLAKLVREPVEGDEWLYEIKYDGVRALAIRDGAGRGEDGSAARQTRIYARSGVEITRRYPELARAFDSLPFERFVMDGEIVALGDDGRPNFQLLQRRMHVEESREVERLSLAVPVTCYIFDLLAFGGFDLRPLALDVRKRMLSRVIKGEGPLRYCDHWIGSGRAFYEEVAGAGLEGIIAKRRDMPYRGRRSVEWLKIKCPLTRRCVIGGYTDPAGARSYFGALLLGLYEPDGRLRFIGKVGTGFDESALRELHRLMAARARPTSPFRRPASGEIALPRRGAHFCKPELVCQVRFTEVTDDGGLRQPSFLGLVEGANPGECRFEPPHHLEIPAPGAEGGAPGKPGLGPSPNGKARAFTVTNPDKIFWPKEGYTKGDLVEYYRSIAKWMLPYLKDRPVMLVRYPDGIEGKSFFQKDAPGFAPGWIRTEKIYSEDSRREIAYFILESAEALGYVANLGAIPIHMWSSRIPHLEHPDWLLFDLDPKGSTTENAVKVALELAEVLHQLGLRPCVKTSGQMGLHVVVGLTPAYTYEQARSFSELVARLVGARIPDLATLNRTVAARKGRVYIDYLQLGHGKTIAAPFAVRPLAGAPVSAPLGLRELRPDLDPTVYNMKTVPRRMARLGRDPFIGVLEDKQSLEDALPKLEAELHATDMYS